MKRALLAFAFVTALAPPVLAQGEPKTPPQAPPQTTEPGAPSPKPRVHVYGQVFIGESVPDYRLDGSDGLIVRPSRFRGNWELMVFADRKEMLAPLAAVHDSLLPFGVSIFGVCREKAHNLRSYSSRLALPFVLGADVTGEVSALFGLYDAVHSTISPGLLLIDRSGVVRMALLGQHLPPDQVAALVRYAIAGQ